MRLPWPISLLCRPKPRERTAAQRVGAWGEQVAADHLAALGYRILARNVRFGSRREIDLVARCANPETLVFVEVKTRSSEVRGRPISAVDRAKRRARGSAAQRYLRRLSAKPSHIRFDVVEVVGSPGGNPPIVRHLQNAFTPGNGFRLPW